MQRTQCTYVCRRCDRGSAAQRRVAADGRFIADWIKRWVMRSAVRWISLESAELTLVFPDTYLGFVRPRLVIGEHSEVFSV
jgi:hypothetical protein